ncbi:MAG: M20 family peptidase [Candidatus Thorarchaeota archaeon]|nr:M20 family peptidase [Candidatus Thorarchaeota archaeon]
MAGFTMTNQKRLLALLRDLVATNSENPPGKEEEVAKVLRCHMEDHGIACKSVGPKERPNLIFYSQEDETGSLVMHGHMDTVPVGPVEAWDYDPFGAELVDGLIYGRGVCDMKGPLSALAEALILYTDSGGKEPLLFLATSDEESGCSGAEEIVQSQLLRSVSFGVCAEPTDLNILVGEKGMFWSRIVATGKSAHGSRPQEGVNAIQLCIEGLSVLLASEYPFEPDELMGSPTLNVGLAKGGVKINVVPDHCEIHLDMRTVKGQTPESVLEEMNSRLESAGLASRVKVEYIHGKPAVLTPVDSRIVKVGCEVVEQITGIRPTLGAATYGTDCSVLQPKGGITNIVCGPGSIEQAHQPNEFIRMNQLLQSVDVYLGIANKIAF